MLQCADRTNKAAHHRDGHIYKSVKYRQRVKRQQSKIVTYECSAIGLMMTFDKVRHLVSTYSPILYTFAC